VRCGIERTPCDTAPIGIGQKATGTSHCFYSLYGIKRSRAVGQTVGAVGMANGPSLW
jgi:hypothetical protein